MYLPFIGCRRFGRSRAIPTSGLLDSLLLYHSVYILICDDLLCVLISHCVCENNSYYFQISCGVVHHHLRSSYNACRQRNEHLVLETNIRDSSEYVAKSRNARQVINISHFNRRERYKDRCALRFWVLTLLGYFSTNVDIFFRNNIPISHYSIYYNCTRYGEKNPEKLICCNQFFITGKTEICLNRFFK